MNRATAARKIQAIFRAKRVFTENFSGARYSKPVVTSFVATVDGKMTVNFSKIAGFKEVAGFVKGVKNARVRYVNGKLYGNANTPLSLVRAKRKGITIQGRKDKIILAGSDITDIKDILKMAYKNGWITASTRDQTPEFRLIIGKFNINRKIDLNDLKDLLKFIPASTFREAPSTHPEEIGGRHLNALNIKFSAGVTLHVFGNGTVAFSGIKTLGDINKPRDILREIIKDSESIFKGSPQFRLPKFVNSHRIRLAGRYPLAAGGNWAKVPSTRIPAGYYIRPGTDGLPRLYPYQYLRKLPEGPVVANGPPVDLGPLVAKVKKAFEEVGHPIPESTLRIFRNAGHSLTAASPENKVKYANTAERRAPSWNATRNGFYVRPGPGRQPYWAKVPKGIATGKATVIKKYTEAGRNIPATVRRIFKIANNVKTARNNGPAHIIGKNGSINGRQWKRLTKAELLAVARNMGIPQVTNKMAPANIADHILNKAHPRPNILLKIKKQEPAPPPRSPNSVGSNANNFGLELEFMSRLQKNLGNNLYKNGNEAEFIKIYKNLPTGARGKPLKAAVNAAYKRFVKNQFLFRGRGNMLKKPRAPRNQTLNYVYQINSVNFSNTLEKAGLNSGRNWTWNEIRAALKDKMTATQLKKLKARWNTNVVARARAVGGAAGPVKRKVSRKKN
jgi:hypothetical protein